MNANDKFSFKIDKDLIQPQNEQIKRKQDSKMERMLEE